MTTDKHSTSWQGISKWYDDAVGEKGHHYHQTIVIPRVLKLLDFPKSQTSSLLDLACGQGVLSRHLPPNTHYAGVDVAADFIRLARQYNKNPTYQFSVADVAKSISIGKEKFSHCSIILALQNIKDPFKVMENAYSHLQAQGRFVLVLNHPCFRIPRQSSWEIDEAQKMQYRRINRYMTPMEIPISTNPSKGEKSQVSLSFHHPLTDYVRWLHEAGFAIDQLEEWCSDKVSVGKAAKMENRSREEFPLFLAISARKI